MTSRKPIQDRVPHLRQRQRSDGSWRVWWEPDAAARRLGFDVHELNADTPTWSIRQARRLNAEVDEARATGKRPTVARGSRTVSELIHRFQKSGDFLEKAPATRKFYISLLNVIDRAWGADLVANLTKPAMHEWHQKLRRSSSPRMTEAVMRMTHQLLGFAELSGWRAEGSNPVQGLRIKTPPARSRRLSWEETDALADTADRLGWFAAGTAIRMGMWQAQRQTDILSASPRSFAWRELPDPETGTAHRLLVWELQQSKRGTLVAMAVHPELAARIQQTIARIPADAAFLLIDEATGRPYANPEQPGSFHLFHKRFAAIRTAAARAIPSLATCQFRDLRRTQAHRARQVGVSRDDAGDLLGNTVARDFSLGEVYMGPQFWTATRAVLAVQRPAKERD